jgi:hypothetical protein
MKFQLAVLKGRSVVIRRLGYKVGVKFPTFNGILRPWNNDMFATVYQLSP